MKRFTIIVWSALIVACVSPSPHPPIVSPPVPVTCEVPAAEQQCDDIWQQELGRHIDDVGLQGCLAQFRACDSGGAIRDGVRSSQEYRDRQAAIEAAKQFRPITIAGRGYVQDGQPWAGRLMSELSILRRSPSERDARLDEVRATCDSGLCANGVRVFAGALTWADQTPEMARAALPGLMDAAAARGLAVLVDAVTDSGTGYDVPVHLQAVADILRGRPNLVGVTCANEYWHPSQSRQVNDAAWLARTCGAIMDAAGIPWDLGSPNFDEPAPDGAWPIPTGRFVTVHLDRGRDPLNMIRRLREVYAVEDAARVPVWNAEMIGADETEQPGRRSANPSIFFAAGALGAAFGIDGVFHSQAGLDAVAMGPVTAACARAFLAGAAAIGSFRGQYQNVGWAASPVHSAQFAEVGGDVVRAYSFVDGDQAMVIVLHTSDVLSDHSIAWADGWHVDPHASRPHVSIYWAHRAQPIQGAVQ